MKGALGDVCLQTGFAQLLQYALDMDFMLSFDLTIDQDVIKVRSTEFVEIFLQGVIDVILERGWAIAQAKRHDEILKKAEMSTECSQGFIAFSDTESVERSNNVQLGEDSGSAQTIQGFRDQR